MSRAILALAVLTGFAFAGGARGQEPAQARPANSVVAFARDSSAIDQFRENPETVRLMVEETIKAATGQRDYAAAWKSLVQPRDRVGIKITTAGGPFFSSHRSVVATIVAGLQLAGVAAKDIVVWDARSADMAAAGYRQPAAYRLWAVDPPSGYDRETTLTAPVLGKLIWGDLLFSGKGELRDGSVQRDMPDAVSSDSHLAQVFSQVTKIIDVPVMSDSQCGVAGCLYNMTIPNIDNWRRFLQPPDFGDPYICDLYADPHIAPKVILHVMDALVAQYAGGPEFQPNYAFQFNTIYVSKDPVAIDATALRELEKWRVLAKLPPIGPRAAYVKSAATAGLGNYEPDQIVLKQAIPER